MMIKHRIVKKIIYVENNCDECGGKLEFSNRTPTGDPPVYQYYCSECGRTHLLSSGELPGTILYEFEEEE